MFHVLDHSDVVYTDATLIRLYGVNMLDAAINRFEALITYDEFHCPRKAAEIYGQRHGLNLQAA